MAEIRANSASIQTDSDSHFRKIQSMIQIDSDSNLRKIQ